MRFGHDTSGNYGYYKVGADTLNPFNNTEMKLIWTNPSPSSAFAPQTLSLDLSKYRYIIIFCNISTNASDGKSNDGGFFTVPSNGGNIPAEWNYRSVSSVSASGIVLGYGYNHGGSTQYINQAIPTYVYGIVK